MDAKNDIRGANVKFPPPLMFLSWVIAAYGLHYILPISFGGTFWLIYAGGFLIIAGVLLILIAGYSFRKARTHIEPWKPTSSIVTSGIYAYSRNPIYLGMSVIVVGIGVTLDSVVVALSFVPALIVVYYYVVRKEEAYLEAKFGEEYLDYKRRVRRWV